MLNLPIPGTIRLSDVVSALSAALDLTEGQPMGHAIRSCIIGMKIAEELKLSPQECSDLYYALLLKDSGCSTNAARMHKILGSDDIKAKREVKFEDWTKPSLSGLRYLLRNVMPGKSFARRLAKSVELGLQQKKNNAEMIGARCERGAEIARQIGMTEATAQAIRSLDEHWNGAGYPEGLQKEEIPLLARIINVSQTAEVFASGRSPVDAVQVIGERSGTWFDPEIARVIRSLKRNDGFWLNVLSRHAREYAMQMEPGAATQASPERIDSLCQAFAQVIDTKSPYTYNHSVGVATAAVEIAQGMGLAANTTTMVRRAALLHDIGKLSVSNSILEKPGKLDEGEWMVMRQHPVYTRVILQNISGFEHLAFVAAAHHERLDGSGYPDGLHAEELPLTARIICVADVYQAITENRPYREGMAADEAFGIMDKQAKGYLDPDCVGVLKNNHLPAEKESEQARAVGA